VSPTAPNTPTPNPLAALLPAGAKPQVYQGWEIDLDCAPNTMAALPYQNADGSLGLALVDALQGGQTVYWDWQVEPAASNTTWQDIRRLRRLAGSNTLAFVGRDSQENWWIGVVLGLCQTPGLAALLPVSGPENLFLDVTFFEGAASPEYWVIEKSTLTLYRWDGSQAAARWTLESVPQNAVSPWQESPLTDVTGDGWPELVLRWHAWQEGIVMSSEETLVQIFQPEGDGYRLVGQFAPGLQLNDVDRDGLAEFLAPAPAAAPELWEVYGWNGSEFTLEATLARPSAPQPQAPSLKALPPLSRDLYFTRGGSLWRWPQAGGALEPVEEPPAAATDPCADVPIEWEVASWSPGCLYAVVRIPGEVEGNTYAVQQVGGVVIPIPGSLTSGRGYSTFGWEAGNQYLVHARADGGERLERIWLPGGVAETLLTLSSQMGIGAETPFFGAIDPYIFADGSTGFAIQSMQAQLYPPAGVYRRLADGQLQMLARIPLLAVPNDRAFYSHVLWSPDGSQFLYRAPLSEQAPPYSALLLGASDGSRLLDLAPVLSDAKDFFWGE
jgi:hypothetical protein